MSTIEKGIYVIVADNDKQHRMSDGSICFDENGPLILDRYVQEADLESVKKDVQRLSKHFGRCRVAKLIFLEE